MNYVLWSILGLCLGSFYTVILTRRGRNSRSLFVPSFCDRCEHRLGISDLIPLLSFCILKGRCRWCSQRISFLYPCVELLTVSLLFFCLNQFKEVDLAVYAFLLYSTLFLIVFIDIRDKQIPDGLLLILGGLSILNVFIALDPVRHLISSLILGGTFGALRLLSERFYGRSFLGWGDIKLVMILGLWLEYSHIPTLLIYAGGTGFLFGLFWQWARKEKEFPFAPSLILAALLV